MSVSELDINSPEWYRGVSVQCENCPQEEGSYLWKTLYLALREVGKQLKPNEKHLAKATAEWHSQETGHRVYIMWLKKLPWLR